MRKWSFILVLLGALFVIGGKPAEAHEAPEGWIRYPNPTAEDIRCGGYSELEWTVARGGDALVVTPHVGSYQGDALPFDLKGIGGEEDGMMGTRHVHQVEEGWLIGFDAGEFGGSLWWFNRDGSTHQKLADDNVVDLVEFSNVVLALAGLAHLGMDYGKVLSVKKDEVKGWTVNPIADLSGAPRTFAVESPESVLILTTKDLVRVTLTGSVEPLLKTQYPFLYPNSMVLWPGGVIHIGMRHFITRLTRTGTGYQEDWYVPQDCQRFELEDVDCICTSETSAGRIE